MNTHAFPFASSLIQGAPAGIFVSAEAAAGSLLDRLLGDVKHLDFKIEGFASKGMVKI